MLKKTKVKIKIEFFLHFRALEKFVDFPIQIKKETSGGGGGTQYPSVLRWCVRKRKNQKTIKQMVLCIPTRYDMQRNSLCLKKYSAIHFFAFFSSFKVSQNFVQNVT